MTNKIPQFLKTCVPAQSKLQPGYWETVTDLYNQGKYKDALIGLLNYIDPEIPERTSNREKTEFRIPHGSVIVNLKIENEILSVITPFLKLPEKNKIPLLRKIAEINFSPLTLASIILEGEELKFTYSAPLSLCEPYKMYYLFKEMCLFADKYDDEFIQKFGAQRFQEPKIYKFSPEQIEEAWNTLQIYLKETNELAAFFEEKRLTGFQGDILIQLFMTLDYYLSPQGVLRSDIENIVSFMLDKYNPQHEQIEKGKAFLKKMQELKKEDFINSFYMTDLFIPPRYAANLQSIKDTSKNSYETAKKEISNSDWMGAALTIKYIFLYQFFYSYPIPGAAELMNNALVESANKPWNDAAMVLWKAVDMIMKDEIPAQTKKVPEKAKLQNTSGGDKGENKKSKGFFGKIFNN
jgi:hypothetical protein